MLKSSTGSFGNKMAMGLEGSVAILPGQAKPLESNLFKGHAIEGKQIDTKRTPSVPVPVMQARSLNKIEQIEIFSSGDTLKPGSPPSDGEESGCSSPVDSPSSPRSESGETTPTDTGSPLGASYSLSESLSSSDSWSSDDELDLADGPRRRLSYDDASEKGKEKDVSSSDDEGSLGSSWEGDSKIATFEPSNPRHEEKYVPQIKFFAPSGLRNLSGTAKGLQSSSSLHDKSDLPSFKTPWAFHKVEFVEKWDGGVKKYFAVVKSCHLESAYIRYYIPMLEKLRHSSNAEWTAMEWAADVEATEDDLALKKQELANKHANYLRASFALDYVHLSESTRESMVRALVAYRIGCATKVMFDVLSQDARDAVLAELEDKLSQKQREVLIQSLSEDTLPEEKLRKQNLLITALLEGQNQDLVKNFDNFRHEIEQRYSSSKKKGNCTLF